MKIIVKKFSFNRSWYQTDQAEFETYAQAVEFVQRIQKREKWNRFWCKSIITIKCTFPQGDFAEIWFD